MKRFASHMRVSRFGISNPHSLNVRVGFRGGVRK